MCPAFKGKSFSTASIQKTPVWRLHLFSKLNDMNVRDPLAARHHLFLGLEVCSWAKRSGCANGKPIRSAALLRKKSVSEAWVSSSSSATASDDHLSISHQWMMTVILCNHGRLGVGDEWTVPSVTNWYLCLWGFWFLCLHKTKQTEDSYYGY